MYLGEVLAKSKQNTTDTHARFWPTPIHVLIARYAGVRHLMHYIGHSRHRGNSLHEILDSTNQIDSARTGNALPASKSTEMIGYYQNLRTRMSWS
jgi:hypothetical protein